MFQRSSMRYAHANGYSNVTYSQSGDWIITCGADGDVRKWRSINDDDPTSHCLGEFVTCIAEHKNQLFAATDLNTVQAFTFPEMDRDGTRIRFTAMVTCIEVSNQYLAAGSEDTTIKVLKLGSEEVETVLKGHEGPVLSLDISSNNLLASASGDGSLKVWDLSSMKEIKSINGLPKVKSFEEAVFYTTPTFSSMDGAVMAYVYGKEVIVLDTTTWDIKFTFTDDQITNHYTCCRFSHDGLMLAAATKEGEFSIYDFIRKKKIKCERSIESCAITSLAWNPNDSKELAFCDNTGQLGTLFFSRVSSDEVSNEESVDNDAIESDLNFIQSEVEDDGISLEKLKNETINTISRKQIEDNINRNYARSRQSSISESDARSLQKHSKKQRPFQPSSTPVDLEHRYLAWNNVGIVTAHQDTLGDGSIDVEFHDASVHHSLHIPNFNNNYTIASLSSTILALTGENATKVTCIVLATSGNKEWSIEMPDCEGVQALGCSSKFIGVATDMRFIRLYSVMGTQREVICIPGEVVAMAGFNDRFIICYHSGPSYDDQHLSALLIQFLGMNLRSREIRVPLPPGRKITWLGYSDCGSPVLSDNMGLVQLYNMKTNLWYPICDTVKHSPNVLNNFFVIDVSERNQIVQAVLCRGCSYPMTNPRPIITEIAMQLPLCDLDTEKSQLEDLLTRSCNFGLIDAEKKIKETAIKLFAAACRAELEMRAKELIEMIASPKLVPLAEKFASKLGRIHLSDKLKELLPKFEEDSNGPERQNKAIETDDLNLFENSTLSEGFMLNHFKSIRETTTKLVPKTMALSNQKRNPFKRLSMQSNISEKSSVLEIDPNTQSTDILSPNIEITSQSLEQENTKEKKGFSSWYLENKKRLEESYPRNSAEELIKIGMKEFKDLTHIQVSNRTNPFACKRKISQVDPKEASGEGQHRDYIVGKLAKFEYKK